MTSSFRAFARIEEPLLASAGASGAPIALVDGDRQVGFGELASRSLAFAAELERRGVRPGDRVTIYLEKSIDAVVAFYGALAAGGIVVPIAEVLRAPQVLHILRDSGSRLLVTSRRRAATLPEEGLGEARWIEVGDRARAETPTAPGTLAGGDTPAAILYTSGSTGRPKGILLSHANLLAGARIVTRYLELTGDDRILSILPFSFDYGLNQLLCAVQSRATLFLQRSHLVGDICRALKSYEITGMAGVPPLFIQLMDRHSPLPHMELPCLRYLTSSGGVLPAELALRYRSRLPLVRLYLMYGLSEAFRSTYLHPSLVERMPSSIGKAIPETEILVLDEEGRACPPGVVGELVHRGPTVALGYWNAPEATARVFRDDPFDPAATRKVVYSGDLVRRDAKGFLYFCGRRDQLIKSHGYRISPDEVEELLLGSGLLVEAAVRGEPDPVAGARVEAHVVPRDPQAFDEAALLAHCRRVMPRYMIPRAVHVHDGLPRTATGKIDRASLGPHPRADEGGP